MGFAWIWLGLPGALGLAVGLQGCAQAPANCHLTQVVSEPVLFVDGLPTIEITMSGHKLRMMVDTGSGTSILTRAAMAALHAQPTIGGEDLYGVGGELLAPTSFAGDMQIDGLKVADALFVIQPTIVPRRPGEPAIDGVIGSDVFRHYNIALDFPHDQIRLYLHTGCVAAFPFTGSFSAEPIDPYAQQHIIVPITVDNQTLHAVIDTGADETLLTQDALEEAGIPVQHVAELKDFTGLGPRKAKVALGKFDSVTIGAEEFDGTLIPVTSTPGFFQALIGEDYLRDRQVFISTETNTAFLGLRTDGTGGSP
jgi:predicted aspartyl protease